MEKKANARLGMVVQGFRQGAELTQVELAEASGLKGSYITALELGRYQLIYPKPFNAIHRVLRFPGWVVLDAMGYATDAGDKDIHPALGALIRAMDEPQQVALLGMVRAWFKPNSGQLAS